MNQETAPESPRPEQILTQAVSNFLEGCEWKPIKTNGRAGMIREKSLELPDKRLLYVSQDIFGGRLGIHNLVQVMTFQVEMPLPDNKHIEWYESGTELKDALIEQPFDIEEVLAEAEELK